MGVSLRRKLLDATVTAKLFQAKAAKIPDQPVRLRNEIAAKRRLSHPVLAAATPAGR
jgi:hypothetical protein